MNHKPDPVFADRMAAAIEELKAQTPAVVIPAGKPDPTGAVRAYPVFLDAYDLIFETESPLQTFAAIASHFNRLAAKNGQRHRVREVEGGLEWIGGE